MTYLFAQICPLPERQRGVFAGITGTIHRAPDYQGIPITPKIRMGVAIISMAFADPTTTSFSGFGTADGGFTE